MNTSSEILDDIPIGKKTIDTDAKTIIPIHHPYERSIYTKGLVGMILCIVPAAIIGLIFVKMSLDQAKDARADIANHPSKYKTSSIQKIKNGRNMALGGLSLFILEIVLIVGFMSAN